MNYEALAEALGFQHTESNDSEIKIYTDYIIFALGNLYNKVMGAKKLTGKQTDVIFNRVIDGKYLFKTKDDIYYYGEMVNEILTNGIVGYYRKHPENLKYYGKLDDPCISQDNISDRILVQ